MSKKTITISIFSIIIISNLLLGIPRLSQFSAVDEPYWTYDRTPDFWRAISERKWKSTNINDKPGISVALISGIGLLAVDPMEYKTYRQKVKTDEIWEKMKEANFYLRLPIFLFTLLSLGLFYFLIKKLTNRPIARLAVIFIGLSPIIFGISLIINPDSLLWIFGSLTILGFLVYQKEENRKYLYLSGIFLGLSLLTKYVANILYVYLLGLIFLGYIFRPEPKPSVKEYIKKSFLDYGILILISLFTLFLLYPATWVKPKMILKATLFSAAFESTWPIFAVFLLAIAMDLFVFHSKITATVIRFIEKRKKWIIFAISGLALAGIAFVFANTYTDMKMVNFESILASPKSSDKTVLTPQFIFGRITADLHSLIFGLTPLVFLGLLWALISTFRKSERTKPESAIISFFILFILFYYFASTVNKVSATVRYQIITYPLASIIAAIGIYKIITLDRLQKYLNRSYIYFVVIGISLISIYLVKPFYFTYSSLLLPEKYVLNLKDMGDGSYEAAEFLNHLPNARELVIWSDKGAVCESFIGRCIISYSRKDVENVYFDYFVTSVGRRSKSLKMDTPLKDSYDFSKLYSSDGGDYKITMNGRPNNFVKITRGIDVKIED